jgi:hypothetical protein
MINRRQDSNDGAAPLQRDVTVWFRVIDSDFVEVGGRRVRLIKSVEVLNVDICPPEQAKS